MKIYVGSDHAGFSAKETLKDVLASFSREAVDCGTFDESRCDYPHFVRAVVENVQRGEGVGILLCGSGIGVSMAANRYAGVRAALCHLPSEAERSVQHNDSNILCLSCRDITRTRIEFIVHAWLNATFEGGRHSERIAQFNDLGEKL